MVGAIKRSSCATALFIRAPQTGVPSCPRLRTVRSDSRAVPATIVVKAGTIAAAGPVVTVPGAMIAARDKPATGHFPATAIETAMIVVAARAATAASSIVPASPVTTLVGAAIATAMSVHAATGVMSATLGATAVVRAVAATVLTPIASTTATIAVVRAATPAARAGLRKAARVASGTARVAATATAPSGPADVRVMTASGAVSAIEASVTATVPRRGRSAIGRAMTGPATTEATRATDTAMTGRVMAGVTIGTARVVATAPVPASTNAVVMIAVVTTEAAHGRAIRRAPADSMTVRKAAATTGRARVAAMARAVPAIDTATIVVAMTVIVTTVVAIIAVATTAVHVPAMAPVAGGSTTDATIGPRTAMTAHPGATNEAARTDVTSGLAITAGTKTAAGSVRALIISTVRIGDATIGRRRAHARSERTHPRAPAST